MDAVHGNALKGSAPYRQATGQGKPAGAPGGSPGSRGAGITYDLSENLELRADYTWYGFDAVDATGATIALGFKF